MATEDPVGPAAFGPSRASADRFPHLNNPVPLSTAVSLPSSASLSPIVADDPVVYPYLPSRIAASADLFPSHPPPARRFGLALLPALLGGDKYIQSMDNVSISQWLRETGAPPEVEKEIFVAMSKVRAHCPNLPPHPGGSQGKTGGGGIGEKAKV